MTLGWNRDPMQAWLHARPTPKSSSPDAAKGLAGLSPARRAPRAPGRVAPTTPAAASPVGGGTRRAGVHLDAPARRPGPARVEARVTARTDGRLDADLAIVATVNATAVLAAVATCWRQWHERPGLSVLIAVATAAGLTAYNRREAGHRRVRDFDAAGADDEGCMDGDDAEFEQAVTYLRTLRGGRR